MFSPDSHKLITISSNVASLWNISGEKITSFKHQKRINSANFSPDGQLILTASFDNTAKVWSLSGELLATLQKHGGGVYDASFSPDGQTIITVSPQDETIRLWDLSGKQLTIIQKDNIGGKAQFSPDGQKIITKSGDNNAYIFNLKGKEISRLQYGYNIIFNFSFSPNNKLIVTGFKTGRSDTIIWNLSGRPIAKIPGWQRSLNNKFSPDSQKIVTINNNGNAIITDLSQLDD